MIENAAAAQDYCAKQLKERYGFDVTHVGDDATGKNDLRDLVIYKPLFAPADKPEQVFGATLQVSTTDKHAASEVLADWSQYYFRDRAEKPFKEALATCEGLVGWAARLIYVHRDDKVWKPEDYEAYMGEGTRRDPHVEVVLMLPQGLDAQAYAQIAAPCFKTLYALNQTMEVSVGVKGLDYRKSPLRSPDADEIDVTSRRDAPDEARLARDFAEYLAQLDTNATWNGNGNPDGRPGDPGSTDSYPTVHWA